MNCEMCMERRASWEATIEDNCKENDLLVCDECMGGLVASMKLFPCALYVKEAKRIPGTH